jgi:hypothetical protein
LSLALGFAIRKVQEGLKMKGTHQCSSYAAAAADDDDVLDENIIVIKKDKNTLLVPYRKVGLEVNAEKMKYGRVWTGKYLLQDMDK